MLAVSYGLGFSYTQASSDENFGLSKGTQRAMVKQLHSPVRAGKGKEEHQPVETYQSLVEEHNNWLAISKDKKRSKADQRKADEKAKKIREEIQDKYPDELEKALEKTKSPRKGGKAVSQVEDQ